METQKIEPKKIAVLFITIFLMIYSKYTTNLVINSIALLSINLLSIITCRKSWKAFIIFGYLLWFNYSIVGANILYNYNNFFTGWKNDYKLMSYGLNILLFFNALLFVMLPFRKERDEEFYNSTHNKDNPIIVVGIVIILSLIFIFGYGRPSETGIRGKTSAIYEYSIILFIIGFYYSGKQWEKTILSIALFAFVLQDMVFGNRTTALLLLVCWFLIFASHKVSFSKTIPFIFIGVMLFSFVGAKRGDNTITLTNVNTVFESLLNRKMMLDTAFAAYYSSLIFIKTEYLVIWGMRLNLFFRFLVSMFLGGNLVKGSNLSSFTRQYFVHYFGGVLPFFAHFYGGYFGILVLSFYFRFIYKYFFFDDGYDEKKDLKKCISIYITCTTPRWYLYSPSPLIRGVLILLILFLICYSFDRSIVNRKHFSNVSN